VKGNMQMKSEIAEHLVDESDFNCVKMHLLNHISDHMCQLGNLKNTSSELPERVMIYFNNSTDNEIVMRPPSRFCK